MWGMSRIRGTLAPLAALLLPLRMAAPAADAAGRSVAARGCSSRPAARARSVAGSSKPSSTAFSSLSAYKPVPVVDAHAVDAVVGADVDGSGQHPLVEVDHEDGRATLADGGGHADAVVPDVGVATPRVDDHLMRVVGQLDGGQAPARRDVVEADRVAALLHHQQHVTPGGGPGGARGRHRETTGERTAARRLDHRTMCHHGSTSFPRLRTLWPHEPLRGPRPSWCVAQVIRATWPVHAATRVATGASPTDPSAFA